MMVACHHFPPRDYSNMAKRDRTSNEQATRKRSRTSSNAESPIQVKEEPSVTKSPSASKKKKRTSSAVGRTIFLRKKIELIISLLPSSLRNSKKSVEDGIRTMLMKYSEGLGGILMGFENVKLIGDRNEEAKGWILNELPHIHYNASCDALVFCPTIGCEVGAVHNNVWAVLFPMVLSLTVLNSITRSYKALSMNVAHPICHSLFLIISMR